MTHWAPKSPGNFSREFIAVYPGGVEHIGRESTWQGSYDDEYTLNEQEFFKSNDLSAIIKKYPPRHTYITDPYWYEGKTSKEIQKKDNHILDNNGPKNILAFNYLWPKYGLTFFKKSLESIIDHVDKYILFLNRFSYIGTCCEQCDIDYVEKICSKYDNVEIIYNNDQDAKENELESNVKYYFTIAGQYAVKHNYSYLWLVQTDEIYDQENINKVIDYITNNRFENLGVIFSLSTYINSPHWRVYPKEIYQRSSVVHVKELVCKNYDIDLINKIFIEDIEYHHFTYVLRDKELLYKMTNWGHRHQIKSVPKYIEKLSNTKTDIKAINLHPIDSQKMLYNVLEYTNQTINKECFLEYIKDIFLRNNPYDNISNLYSKYSSDFPVNVDEFMSLTIQERRFLCGFVKEFLPLEPVIVELGCFNGRVLDMLSNFYSKTVLYGIQDYDNLDPLYGQYQLSAEHVYNKMLNSFIGRNKYINVLNDNVKLISIFPNNYIDLVFINTGIDSQTIKSAIIESWPKLKDGAWLMGRFSNSDFIKTVLNELITNTIVECPWGKEMFNFYEVYYNIIKDVEMEFNIDLSPHHNIWIARVRKS